MLGMLIKVLCGDAITTRRRLPSEGNVTFEDLMRGASDFDARTVTIEGLTSVRYLLSVTVGIVTVIAPIWSAGLSWSHDTCAFEERFDRYPVRAYRDAWVAGSEGAAPLFCTAPALPRPHARWGRPYFQQGFWCNAPQNRPHWLWLVQVTSPLARCGKGLSGAAQAALWSANKLSGGSASSGVNRGSKRNRVPQ